MEDNGNVPSGAGSQQDPLTIGDEFSSISPPKRSCDCLKNGLMIAVLVAAITILSYIPFSLYFLSNLEESVVAYDDAIVLSENWLNALSFDAQTLRMEDRITQEEYVLINDQLQEFSGSIVGVQVFNNALFSLLAVTKVFDVGNIFNCRFMAKTVEANLRSLLTKEAELEKILEEFKKRDGKKQECFLFQKTPYFLPA